MATVQPLTLARLRRILPAALVACQAAGHAAHAADSSEFWPEFSAFVGLGPRARLYLDVSNATGKESDTRSRDLSAFVDISIEPIVREQLRTEDWQRSRFLWARLGYTHVQKASATAPQAGENRGVASVLAKAPLPAEVWLEARARADLRWIDGDYSQRYRFRVEATREFTVLEHTVVPYANAEGFYDTRYDGWARALYQAGVEVTVDEHFRFEVYLARQADRLPKKEDLNALGLVAKWYY
jgi:hypothetical protein